jgi:hypothetical protein
MSLRKMLFPDKETRKQNVMRNLNETVSKIKEEERKDIQDPYYKITLEKRYNLQLEKARKLGCNTKYYEGTRREY